MRYTLAFLLALPFAALADGHHPKPEPKPPVSAAPRCSCWWQPVLVIGGTVGVVYGLTLIKSDDGKKKAEIRPTDDGRGATAVVEVRF